MSLFRRIIDRVQLNPSATGTALGGTTIYTIKNRQYWLDGIMLTCRIKHGATTLSSFKSDGIWNFIKRVQLTANEGDGASRTIVDAHGVALIEESKQLLGFLDADTQYNQTRTGITATEVQWTIPIWFRHPIFPEPVAIRTALPLPRYGADPELRIDYGVLADVAGAGALDATFGNVAVEATFLYREVIDLDNTFPHWKQEIISRDHNWAGSGAQQFEIPSTGLLASVLCQHFTAAGTRGAIQNEDTADMTLEYRNRNIQRITSRAQYALLGYSTSWPTTSYSGYTWCANFFDLISDVTMTDAFHLRSALDLSPEAMKGGKAYIKASNLASTGYITRFLTRKFMVTADEVSRTTI